jgi:hypothetical protein
MIVEQKTENNEDGKTLVLVLILSADLMLIFTLPKNGGPWLASAVSILYNVHISKYNQK